MSRKLKNIKITKKGDITFDYENHTRYYMSNSIEAIKMNMDGITFNASTSKVNKRDVQFYQATKDDFEFLKKTLSENSKYFACGSKFIFSVENIVGYDVNSDNLLTVDCKNKSYSVYKLTEEEIKSFIEMMELKLAEDEESCDVD